MQLSLLKKLTMSALVIGAAITLTACQHVNIPAGGNEPSGRAVTFGDIKAGAGATIGGAMSTGKGDIDIADEVKAKGLKTTLGAIRIGNKATIEGTVENSGGDINIGKDTKIVGDVKADNGAIYIAEGAEITGNVIGTRVIRITGAKVSGRVSGTTGNITLIDTEVGGMVTLERSQGMIASGDKLILDIGKDTEIDGDVRVSQNVRIRMHKSADVDGKIEGAQPEEYKD